MAIPACPNCKGSNSTFVSSEGQFGYSRVVRNCTDCGENWAYWTGPDDDGHMKGKL